MLIFGFYGPLVQVYFSLTYTGYSSLNKLKIVNILYDTNQLQ